MAIKITDECINCGACEPECPNNAIYEGGVEWAKNRNAWFDDENIELAIAGITGCFLQEEALQKWAQQYPTPAESKIVGIVIFMRVKY